MKDKKLLISIFSVIIAIILLVLGCMGIKNTHVAAKVDMNMGLIFTLSLLVACFSYMWVLSMSIAILDAVTSKKKNKKQ